MLEIGRPFLEGDRRLHVQILRAHVGPQMPHVLLEEFPANTSPGSRCIYSPRPSADASQVRVHGHRFPPLPVHLGQEAGGGTDGYTRAKVPTPGHVKKSKLRNHVLTVTSFKITPVCASKLFMPGHGGKGPRRQHAPTLLCGTPGCGNGRAEWIVFSSSFTFTAFELFYNRGSFHDSKNK